jgi:hypothetical protein
VSANSTISARKVDFFVIYHNISYKLLAFKEKYLQSVIHRPIYSTKKPVILISTYIATAKGGINHV